MARRPDPPTFLWNERAGRYADASGRFISSATLRKWIDEAIDTRTRRVTELTQDLQRGRVTLEEWDIEMRRAVKDVHIYNAMAAKGGQGQMMAADFGRVGAEVRRQYAFLGTFRTQLERGLPQTGDIVRRAAMYAQSGRATFDQVQRTVMLGRGMAEERSLLHPAEHCDECIAEAARGFVPIGTLTPVGERTCLGNCRCTVEYRSAA